MTLKFVITADNIVHLNACKESEGGLPYRTSIDTIDGMYANLARVDIKDNHTYPCLLSPCQTCLA